MRNLRIAFGGLVTALLLSCGDGDGGSCGEFTPCGGDVVGTWAIKDMCMTNAGSAMIEECPSATMSVDGLTATGSVTYRADMTMMSTTTLRGSMKMNIPGSCLMGASCALLDTALRQSLLEDPEGAFGSVSCTGSSSCTCTIGFKETPMTDSGTYSVSGNKITENGDENEYCVAGQEMRIRSIMSMGGMMDDLRFAIRMEKQ